MPRRSSSRVSGEMQYLHDREMNLLTCNQSSAVIRPRAASIQMEASKTILGLGSISRPGSSLKITLAEKKHKSLAADWVVRGTDGVHVVKEYAGPISFLDESVIVDSGVLVYGDVRALNVEIRPNAAVNGNIFARDTVTLFNKCLVVGDVTTRKISIEEGSFLKGVLDIRYQEVNRGKSAV